MPTFCKNLIATVLLGVAAGTAGAVDSASVEYGTGNQTDLLRVSAQWNWDKPVLSFSGSQIVGQWDVSLAQWHGTRYNNTVGSTQNLTSVGLTPVLRWQRPDARGVYGEAGLGVHYLSGLYNNNGSQLSTNYQFGSLLGVGYRYSKQMEVGVRIQHFSNGGFKQPNTGVNFAIVRGAYHF